MKKILIIIILVLLPIAVISFHKETNFSMEEDNTEPKEIIDIDDYVYNVVAAEMPILFEEEALKAQIVATRTYSLYEINEYGRINKEEQAYITDEELKEKWQSNYEEYSNKLKKLISETKDIITYNDKPIKAYYFSMSNGYTASSQTVFNESYDYIDVVPSPLELNVNNFEVTNNYSIEEFKKILNIEGNINIQDIKRDNTNRVLTITINNREYKGTEFRKLFNLRSTDFKIDIQDSVNITTKGYGHGVGMSQYGANELAKQGYTYQEILKYYYKDIELKKYE